MPVACSRSFSNELLIKVQHNLHLNRNESDQRLDICKNRPGRRLDSHCAEIFHSHQFGWIGLDCTVELYYHNHNQGRYHYEQLLWSSSVGNDIYLQDLIRKSLS